MIKLNKKKKIVLFILAIPFTRGLIHYLFYPKEIMRRLSPQEHLNAIFDSSISSRTGRYYSFAEHLSFSFSKNHEIHSGFLLDNFDVWEVNGLWLYLPAIFLILLLVWLFKGEGG